MYTCRRVLLAVLFISVLGLTGCTSTPPSKESSTAPAPDILEKDNSQQQALLDAEQFSKNLKTIKPQQLKDQLPLGLLANGNVVALETTTNQPNRLQIVKPSGETAQVLATAENNRHIYSAAVSQNWVVYVEASSNMIKADWKIMAIRQDGSETISIDNGKTKWEDFKLSTETLVGPELSASGNMVAWSTFEKNQNGEVQAVVRTYDLKSRENKLIEATSVQVGEDYGHPKIDGSNIVYDRGKIDFTAGGRWGTIVLRNLQTGDVKELDHGLDYSVPQVQGNRVVWMAGRNDVKMYDIQTHETKTVISGKGVERWLPSLNNQMITWYANASKSQAYLFSGQKIIDIRPSDTNGGAKVIGSLLFWISNAQKGNAVVEWLDLNHTTSTSM